MTEQSLLGSRYQLDDVLGRGGMAEVRSGHDHRLGRPVAVKRLKVELAADPGFQERFRREAHAAAILNHPGIAAVYDSGEETDPGSGVAVPYLVMELVEGPTLREVLRDSGPLPPSRALELTKVVLDALDHSHAAGIVHRDIKPSNIMLTPSGSTKVMDFGIARAATETTSGLTETAMVLGTAHYLSPEQARGERVDLRSDLYSTGCLLYELLLGRPPFVGDSSISVVYQHVSEPPVPPSQLDARLGTDIDALIAKALAKDPADRYQSAAEMAADIGRVLAGQPVLAALPAEQDEITRISPITPVPLPVTEIEGEATHALPAAPVVPPTGIAPPPNAPPPTRIIRPSGRPRRTAVRAFLLAAVALVLLAGVAFGLYRALVPGNQVSVPSVLGSTRAAAEQEMRDAGLQPAFRHVAGPDDDTRDTVVGQTPEPGTEVGTGATVTAEINVGPATSKIPDDLVGRDLDRVLEKLQDAGFSNVQAVPVENPPEDADADEVVAVDPGEGEKAALEEDIVVSYVGWANPPTDRPNTGPGENGGRQPSAMDQPTAKDEPSGSTAPEEDQTTGGPSTAPAESAEPTATAAEPSASASATAPEVTEQPEVVDPVETEQPEVGPVETQLPEVAEVPVQIQ